MTSTAPPHLLTPPHGAQGFRTGAFSPSHCFPMAALSRASLYPQEKCHQGQRNICCMVSLADVYPLLKAGFSLH